MLLLFSFLSLDVRSDLFIAKFLPLSDGTFELTVSESSAWPLTQHAEGSGPHPIPFTQDFWPRTQTADPLIVRSLFIPQERKRENQFSLSPLAVLRASAFRGSRSSLLREVNGVGRTDRHPPAPVRWPFHTLRSIERTKRRAEACLPLDLAMPVPVGLVKGAACFTNDWLLGKSLTTGHNYPKINLICWNKIYPRCNGSTPDSSTNSTLSNHSAVDQRGTAYIRIHSAPAAITIESDT